MFTYIFDFILHLDTHLASFTAAYGVFTYLLLFIIIFCETGLVIFPFLPGDSLLFAAGALAALGSLNFLLLLLLLMAAAILGDTTNYLVGHFFGDRLIHLPHSPIKKAHLDKTHAFFTKHGGKTIILARFVPIVRTLAPFVAGLGTMHYSTFIRFNIIGGISWVCLFTGVGYFFGNLPSVKHNFSLVIFAIIGISLLPMITEYLKSKKHP